MSKLKKEAIYKMDAVDIYKLILKGKDIKIFPRGFWKQPEAKKNAKKCTKYLVEEILKLNDEDITTKITASLFSKNKLGGMLYICFNNSPYQAINNVYPGKYKEWEFKQVPNGYWSNKENAIAATKWLIEEKLMLSEEDLKKVLSYELFLEHRLVGMLNICFDGSPYEAIAAAYPNKYKEWEFKSVPNKYWEKEENRTKATKWLVEEKLKLTKEDLKKGIPCSAFSENGLLGMLNICFDGSPYKAISNAYKDIC